MVPGRANASTRLNRPRASRPAPRSVRRAAKLTATTAVGDATSGAVLHRPTCATTHPDMSISTARDLRAGAGIVRARIQKKRWRFFSARYGNGCRDFSPETAKSERDFDVPGSGRHGRRKSAIPGPVASTLLGWSGRFRRHTSYGRKVDHLLHQGQGRLSSVDGGRATAQPEFVIPTMK